MISSYYFDGFHQVEKVQLQKLWNRIRRGDQKRDEPFRRSTSYHCVKIVKVLSSLTSAFLMCNVALVLSYCVFTGVCSG